MTDAATMTEICGIPGTNEDAIEQLRGATDPVQIIVREVLEEARDGKLPRDRIAGETFVRQALARAALERR